MPITTIYDPEDLIIDLVRDLFNEELIFIDADVSELSNEVFLDFEDADDRVGILVLNAGFRTDPLTGNSRSPVQRLKMLWQVIIVCPKELYKTNGAVKQMEVMQLLKGSRLSPEVGIMQLVDDERGFNRPDMEADLAYLPMMFTVETVI